ncbi:MAG: hypothetical protein AVDCRST_MAG27-2616, partial [uncultured Craurococcus sp.]
ERRHRAYHHRPPRGRRRHPADEPAEDVECPRPRDDPRLPVGARCLEHGSGRRADHRRGRGREGLLCRRRCAAGARAGDRRRCGRHRILLCRGICGQPRHRHHRQALGLADRRRLHGGRHRRLRPWAAGGGDGGGDAGDAGDGHRPLPRCRHQPYPAAAAGGHRHLACAHRRAAPRGGCGGGGARQPLRPEGGAAGAARGAARRRCLGRRALCRGAAGGRLRTASRGDRPLLRAGHHARDPGRARGGGDRLGGGAGEDPPADVADQPLGLARAAAARSRRHARRVPGDGAGAHPQRGEPAPGFPRGGAQRARRQGRQAAVAAGHHRGDRSRGDRGAVRRL